MAHHNTLLGELLRMVPRREFERDARRHHEGGELRSMSRWSQFVAMAMAQLSGRCRLRDVVTNLEAQRRKLYHLGVGRVARSSLARVNQEQPHELFKLQFERLLERCRAVAPGHGFRFKNPLVSLVTRLKRGVRYAVRERRSHAPGRGVTSDQTIELTSKKGRQDCPILLRRVGYRDKKTGKHYVFLTNNFRLSARTIADIYKARWQVELFFKWIKQNLRIKSFLGTSRNAVLTQIWIAMCVHLILAYLKFANRLKWRLSEILRLLQLNLFERRTLNSLLQPERDPPDTATAQLQLEIP